MNYVEQVQMFNVILAMYKYIEQIRMFNIILAMFV